MSKRFDLSGKVALVTGASSGLGVHFARTLAEAGAAVVLAARRAERLASLQAELQKGGAKATAVTLDVQSGEAVAAAFDQADVHVRGAVLDVGERAAVELDEDRQVRVRPQLDAAVHLGLDGTGSELGTRCRGGRFGLRAGLGHSQGQRQAGAAEGMR